MKDAKDYSSNYHEAKYGLIGADEEKFYTPIIAKILYWIAICSATVMMVLKYYLIYTSGVDSCYDWYDVLLRFIPMGLYLVSVLSIRLTYELAVVLFKIHNRLVSIDRKLDAGMK